MPRVSASFHVRTAKMFSCISQPFKPAVFAACKRGKGCSLPSPKAPRVYRQRTFRLSKLAVKCPVFERVTGHLPKRKTTQGRSVRFSHRPQTLLIPPDRSESPTFRTSGDLG